MKAESFIYRLLCFLYLSENTEEVLAPREKRGTRSSGKIINSLPFPLTVVTSKWNVTTKRTEGFDVSGHFRLWKRKTTGEWEMIFINPFKKSGYTRKSWNSADRLQ